MVHQGKEQYVPDATTNMTPNVQCHTQVTRFKSTESLNITGTNLFF